MIDSCRVRSPPLSTAIPADQEDACVNVNDNTTITFTCSSPEFFILWRVASRQIRSTEFESVGISVNTTASSGGGYNSTIEFSGEGIAFLESEVGQNVQFRVACLVEKASFDIVEGDSRTFVIYGRSPSQVSLQDCMCICHITVTTLLHGFIYTIQCT